MATPFYEAMKKTMQHAFTQLGEPITMKQTLAVSGPPKGVDLEELLSDFAITFMAEYFVEEVFRPAFFMGQGIQGFGASQTRRYMPQIEVGYSEFYAEDTYRRNPGTGKGSKVQTYKYRGLQKAINRLNELRDDDNIDPDDRASWSERYREAVDRVTELQQKKSEFEQRESRKETKHQREIIDANAARAGQRENSVTGEWEEGFRDLFTNMTRMSRPNRKGGMIEVQMGPSSALMKQRLGPYSVTSGLASPSEFDSFFYAAEFGTGVAANVGGPQWVREAKKNGSEKAPVSRLTGERGSWWFGSSPFGGGLFTGQQGLHTLYEPATRKPRSLYRNWIEQHLPTRMGAYLAQKTGGRVRLGKSKGGR